MQREKWSLLIFKISQTAVPKNWKISAAEKDEGNTSCSKQREGQKEIIFCSLNCKFLIFCVSYWWLSVVYASYSL